MRGRGGGVKLALWSEQRGPFGLSESIEGPAAVGVLSVLVVVGEVEAMIERGWDRRCLMALAARSVAGAFGCGRIPAIGGSCAAAG